MWEITVSFIPLIIFHREEGKPISTLSYSMDFGPEKKSQRVVEVISSNLLFKQGSFFKAICSQFLIYSRRETLQPVLFSWNFMQFISYLLPLILSLNTTEKSLAMLLISCVPTSRHLETLLRSHKHKPFLLQAGVSAHSAFFHVKDSSVLSSSLWK